MPIDRIDPSEPFFIAPWGDGVCVAAGRHQRPTIQCSRDGVAWTAVKAFSRTARIVDLAAPTDTDGTLAIALDGAKLLTTRIGDDLKATMAARPLPGGPVLARLGGGGDGRPLLAMRRANRGGTLAVYGLRDGKWTALAAPIDVGIGPQLGGPVADGDDVVVPVVQASAGAWPLRVARLAGGRLRLGPSLNHGEGSAQGLLEEGSRHPLAIWQQHSAGRGRTFRASIYVRDLGHGDTKPRLLWTGFDIGPGDLAVEDFAGRMWALTTRARSGHEEKALRVVVAPLS